MPAPPVAPKRVQKSGHQNRKAKAERDAKAAAAKSIGTYLMANAWSPPKQADAQFDPNGAPVELPLYGQPPPTLIRAVSGALNQLRQGAFYASSYLWDSMMEDFGRDLAPAVTASVCRLRG